MILTIAGCHCRTLRGEVFQRNPVKRDTDWVKVAGQRAATVKQDNATGTCAQEGIGRLRNWWGTEEEVCAALFHRCALKGIPGDGQNHCSVCKLPEKWGGLRPGSEWHLFA